MGEASGVAPDPTVVGLLNPAPAQRARLLLAQGEVAAAARRVEERDLGPDDDPGYPREPEYLVLARVLLAQDRAGPALTLLGRLHAAAAAQSAVPIAAATVSGSSRSTWRKQAPGSGLRPALATAHPAVSNSWARSPPSTPCAPITSTRLGLHCLACELLAASGRRYRGGRSCG
jgi:hypothetical protein